MRIYLELIEILPAELAEEADFIRIDITDWARDDIDIAIQLLKEHATQYDHYVIQMHYCGHDENRSCNTELIDMK
jgi:predicted alpha/beta hydrolase